MKTPNSVPAFFLIVALLAACTTSSNTQTEKSVDGHNSQNSLDWAGVYTAEGTLIILKEDQTYLQEDKIGVDSISREKGSFSWDTEGRNITLSESGKQYWIRENNIVQLNDERAPIESSALQKEVTKLSGLYWKLTEINGKDASVFKSGFDRDAYIQFDNAESMVSGNSGCNQIFGSYQADETPGKITLGQLASTMMMCPSMELEREFTETIELTAGYEIEVGALLLKDAEGKTLFRFRRALFKE